MTHDSVTSFATLQSLPPLSRLAFAAALTLLKWEERRLTRRALARMDAVRLDDIGLSRDAAQAEVDKPFWRR